MKHSLQTLFRYVHKIRNNIGEQIETNFVWKYGYAYGIPTLHFLSCSLFIFSLYFFSSSFGTYISYLSFLFLLNIFFPLLLLCFWYILFQLSYHVSPPYLLSISTPSPALLVYTFPPFICYSFTILSFHSFSSFGISTFLFMFLMYRISPHNSTYPFSFLLHFFLLLFFWYTTVSIFHIGASIFFVVRCIFSFFFSFGTLGTGLQLSTQIFRCCLLYHSFFLSSFVTLPFPTLHTFFFFFSIFFIVVRCIVLSYPHHRKYFQRGRVSLDISHYVDVDFFSRVFSSTKDNDGKCLVNVKDVIVTRACSPHFFLPWPWW
jgi:hypothetical protein